MRSKAYLDSSRDLPQGPAVNFVISLCLILLNIDQTYYYVYHCLASEQLPLKGIMCHANEGVA